MWQGGLRRVCADVVRCGELMQAHARQATDQIAASRPVGRPQLQEGPDHAHCQQHPEGHRAGHGRQPR
ncbi:unnamed protein product [Sphagnum troendelagicum]